MNSFLSFIFSTSEGYLSFIVGKDLRGIMCISAITEENKYVCASVSTP